MRFVVTEEGENLTALANRLFCLDSKRGTTAARRRLLELNPHLPDRKNISAGTVVFVPDELDGEAPREGRTLGEITGDLLDPLRHAVSRLDETLGAEARAESARHSDAEKALGDSRLRRAARDNPELAKNVERLGEALADRRRRTSELEALRKRAIPAIEEDLAALLRLAGDAIPG